MIWAWLSLLCFGFSSFASYKALHGAGMWSVQAIVSIICCSCNILAIPAFFWLSHKHSEVSAMQHSSLPWCVMAGICSVAGGTILLATMGQNKNAVAVASAYPLIYMLLLSMSGRQSSVKEWICAGLIALGCYGLS